MNPRLATSERLFQMRKVSRSVFAACLGFLLGCAVCPREGPAPREEPPGAAAAAAAPERSGSRSSPASTGEAIRGSSDEDRRDTREEYGWAEALRHRRRSAELAFQDRETYLASRSLEDRLNDLPVFSDPRILASHRPEEWLGRMEILAERLTKEDLGVSFDSVDCSAVPCLLDLRLSVADDVDLQELMERLDELASDATGLGSSTALLFPPSDGPRRLVRWWMPVDEHADTEYAKAVTRVVDGRVDVRGAWARASRHGLR